MARFDTLTSNVALLPVDDIDTDQIIPARFLKTTEKAGLGPNLFADWRYQKDGSPKADFALYEPAAQGAGILLAGRNFGCGSSREHAPWALVASGFTAIIAESFADIFTSNALKNGLLPVAIDAASHAALIAARKKDPTLRVTVDLPSQTVAWAGGPRVEFPIQAFAKKCLSLGVDELGYLLDFVPQIREYEERTQDARGA